MLHFRLFNFPVTVHWFFWINCALLGGALGADTPAELKRLTAWIAMAFLSIIIHELGHAFVMRRYGDHRVSILLYAFGGLARSTRWHSRTESLLISAAGPAMQLAAAGVAFLLLNALMPGNRWVGYMLFTFVSISIFWALLNLLPIVPLDGGRISLALFGPDKQQTALRISLVCAAAMAVVSFQFLGPFATLFFGMMAFNNWKELRGEPQIPWMAGR